MLQTAPHPFPIPIPAIRSRSVRFQFRFLKTNTIMCAVKVGFLKSEVAGSVSRYDLGIRGVVGRCSAASARW
jgi:hypothetical protein